MSKQRATLIVSPELLIASLKLPEHTRIIGATWQSGRQELDLVVTHPDFEPVGEGQVGPLVTYTYTVTSHWNKGGL